MKTNKHIVVWGLGWLLSLGVTPVLANEVEMDGLHCGDVVTITATPERGYRFVQWSDGNTDNPRDLVITDTTDLDLTAIYEPACQVDDVPVIWLYGQIFMVDVSTMQQKGYVFFEQDVTWYRIVGDIDVTSGENDDQKLATGYYYVNPNEDATQCYVVVDVSNTPPESKTVCESKLIGKLQSAKRTQTTTESMMEDIRLVPNIGHPGTNMEIQGLSMLEHYTIQVFDAVGRKLEEYALMGEERFMIVAQRIPGYYMVCIISEDKKTVLRYIVKQ